jgi:hypothetical protein
LFFRFIKINSRFRSPTISCIVFQAHKRRVAGKSGLHGKEVRRTRHQVFMFKAVVSTLLVIGAAALFNKTRK